MPLTNKELENIEDMLNVQLSPGNWDSDPYMHGMANGMLLVYCMAANIYAVEYKEAPEYWKKRSARWMHYITSKRLRYQIAQIYIKIVEVSLHITIQIRDPNEPYTESGI